MLVLGLGIYRITIGRREVDSIHLAEFEETETQEQKHLVRSIKRVEWWGQALTVLVVIYGLGILGVYLYRMWQESAKLPR